MPRLLGVSRRGIRTYRGSRGNDMTDAQTLLFPASYWMLPTQVEAHVRELGARGLEPKHRGHLDHFKLHLAPRSTAVGYYFEPAGALLERAKVVDHADSFWATAGVAASKIGRDGVRLLASVNGVSAWAVERADYNFEARIGVARRYVSRMTNQIMGAAGLLLATALAVVAGTQAGEGLTAEALTGGSMCVGIAVTIIVPTYFYRRSWNSYWKTISHRQSQATTEGSTA